MLGRFCRRQEIGLLITAHKAMGLPPLFQTAAPLELAQAIVRQLLGGRPSPFTPAEVSQVQARARRRFGEMLFDLYDLYEQRRPSAGQIVT